MTRAEYERKWREEHPDQFRETVRKYRAKNRKKLTAKNKAWHAANPMRSVEYRWKYAYNLPPEAYDQMLTVQGGCCKLCGCPEPGMGYKHFNIDHDHACCPGDRSCGKCIRGLLCGKCNKALGLLNDDAALLRNAAEYVDYTRGQNAA